MHWKPIPFPDKNQIYTDYIHQPENLAPFFPANPFSSIHTVLEQRAQRDYPRQAIADILAQQHQQWSTHPKIETNIAKLTAPGTFAVVTGQQAGVLVSPLYTIYKILTTIHQAQVLQQHYPDFDFVPVFWMEVDDSDFREINHCHYITKQNLIRRLELDESPEDSGKPIFLRSLPESIAEWPDILREDFFPTEFLESVMERYFQAYKPGVPIATAFARVLVQLFGHEGLLILNPSEPAVKALGKPVFTTAIEKRHQILETFWERNRQLEAAGYHSQIHLKHGQTLLFWIDEAGKRVRLDCDDTDDCLLRYSTTQRPITFSEIIAAIEDQPHRFTTNVALRPIFQDFILPTAMYVGGPAEVAYFAQLHALYPLFQLPMPAILPRHRITVVEKKIQKIVQKYGIPYERLFHDNFHFLERDIQERLADHPLVEKLTQLEKKFLNELHTLEGNLQTFDPTLVKALHHTHQSIRQALNKLGNKIQRSAETQDKTRSQQLERLMLYLFPNHHPQERILAPLYFQIKYGWEFFNTLLQELPDDVRTHWVVEL